MYTHQYTNVHTPVHQCTHTSTPMYTNQYSTKQVSVYQCTHSNIPMYLHHYTNVPIPVYHCTTPLCSPQSDDTKPFSRSRWQCVAVVPVLLCKSHYHHIPMRRNKDFISVPSQSTHTQFTTTSWSCWFVRMTVTGFRFQAHINTWSAKYHHHISKCFCMCTWGCAVTK